MKLISNFFVIIFFVLVSSIQYPVSVFAESRNIFGLHLTQTSDIHTAKSVVNSQGGDWGWVTLVARLDQLDHTAWQDFFDNCRKFHLIPIVRLATYSEDDHWKKPALSDIDTLADFLTQLNWPTTDRHIIFFNEINHSQEWGGEVNVKEFTDFSIYAYQKFHRNNPNFVFISSPLDLAAPEAPPELRSAPNIYREIYLYKPEYFENLDALGSHSYPNHGFVGSPNDQGQHSIRGYQWELAFLKGLGVKKDFPVYITETGWPHREGIDRKNQFFTTKTTSTFYLSAIKIWESDPRVVAVTPFIYNYPNPPFDHFSWLDRTETIYPEYQRIIDSPKTSNHPPQQTKYSVAAIHLPILIFSGQYYTGQINLTNTGESIWGETNFCLPSQAPVGVVLDPICTSDKLVYPGQTANFTFSFRLTDANQNPQKIFIGWENLPTYEISSIVSGGSIYRPKTDLKQTFLNLLWNALH